MQIPSSPHSSQTPVWTPFLVCSDSSWRMVRTAAQACRTVTAQAWGTANAQAWGTATAQAYKKATARTCRTATAQAWGIVTAQAWGTANAQAGRTVPWAAELPGLHVGSVYIHPAPQFYGESGISWFYTNNEQLFSFHWKLICHLLASPSSWEWTEWPGLPWWTLREQNVFFFENPCWFGFSPTQLGLP